MRRFLKKLLRLLSAKKFTSGFVVEQFTQNSMSGWILLADKSYPETNNFYFFSAGEKIEISVSLVNRKGCCNLYLSNYYGFQITFAETLDDIESKSFFYNDQQVCIEPSYVSVAHQLAAKPAMPVYYSNKIAMYENLERRLGADVVRMSECQN